MGFFDKLFGKKEKEQLEKPENHRWMKKCWINWKKH
jgi:hypothetical protein